MNLISGLMPDIWPNIWLVNGYLYIVQISGQDTGYPKTQIYGWVLNLISGQLRKSKGPDIRAITTIQNTGKYSMKILTANTTCVLYYVQFSKTYQYKDRTQYMGQAAIGKLSKKSWHEVS